MNDQVSDWLRNTFNDPIVTLLLNSSHLTPHQLESLAIDHLSAAMPAKHLTYAERARIRTPPVSRGAFNRTLHQARRNVVSSLYTILLLAYVGVLQAPPFEEYDNLAAKIHEYSKIVQPTDASASNNTRAIITLRHELQSGIERLSAPQALRPSRTM